MIDIVIDTHSKSHTKLLIMGPTWMHVKFIIHGQCEKRVTLISPQLDDYSYVIWVLAHPSILEAQEYMAMVIQLKWNLPHRIY